MEGLFYQKESGGVLLSHKVPLAVPSALRVLASGFGMGPGVSLSLWPPKHLPHNPRSHAPGEGEVCFRPCPLAMPAGLVCSVVPTPQDVWCQGCSVKRIVADRLSGTT